MRGLNLLKSLALPAVLSSTPAFAPHGDTLTINGLSTVPEGWVIAKASQPRLNQPNHQPTQVTHNINRS